MLDLRDTTFIDSTGLGIIVDTHRASGSNKNAVILRSPQPQVLRALHVSGVDQLVTIHDDGDRD